MSQVRRPVSKVNQQSKMQPGMKQQVLVQVSNHLTRGICTVTSKKIRLKYYGYQSFSLSDSNQ